MRGATGTPRRGRLGPLKARQGRFARIQAVWPTGFRLSGPTLSVDARPVPAVWVTPRRDFESCPTTPARLLVVSRRPGWWSWPPSGSRSPRAPEVPSPPPPTHDRRTTSPSRALGGRRHQRIPDRSPRRASPPALLYPGSRHRPRGSPPALEPVQRQAWRPRQRRPRPHASGTRSSGRVTPMEARSSGS